MRKTAATGSQYRPPFGGGGASQASKTPAAPLAFVPTNRSAIRQPQPQLALVRRNVPTSTPAPSFNSQPPSNPSYNQNIVPQSFQAPAAGRYDPATSATTATSTSLTPRSWQAESTPGGVGDYTQNGLQQAPSASYSQEDDGSGERKRTRIAETQSSEDFDLQGQLKVAMQQINQLKEENVKLKSSGAGHARVAVVGSVETDVETLLMTKEADLKEREEALRQKEIALLAPIIANGSETLEREISVPEKPILEAGYNDENYEAVAAFQHEISNELIVLVRYEAMRHDINSGNAEAHSSLIDEGVARQSAQIQRSSSPPRMSQLGTPIGRRIPPARGVKGTPNTPGSPLSQTNAGFTSVFSTHMFDLSATSVSILNQAFPDRDILLSLSGVNSGVAAQSILNALTNIQKWQTPVSDLVVPLRMLLLPTNRPSVEVILCVSRILYSASIRFTLFRESCIRDGVLLGILMDVLANSSPCSLDVPILRFFSALVGGVQRREIVSDVSLKPFSRILEDGTLQKRITTEGKPIIAECAADLLELLLQRGSDALPDGFPSSPETWHRVPSPFGTGGALGVARCAGVVTSYGSDGIRFLLHHGLLSNLIDAMYTAEEHVVQCSQQSLTLLASAIETLRANMEITPEERLRLISSLLELRDMRSESDEHALLASQAEKLPKAMHVI